MYIPRRLSRIPGVDVRESSRYRGAFQVPSAPAIAWSSDDLSFGSARCRPNGGDPDEVKAPWNNHMLHDLSYRYLGTES